MDCERQGWRGRNPAMCGDKPSGSFRRPSCGGPGSPGAPEATLGVGALPPCAPPPGWRQGTVLPNSCGSPSEGKIVRLLLNPDPQSIQSGAWKLILRNPDVAAGGASEQHVIGAFLFGTQIAWASLTEGIGPRKLAYSARSPPRPVQSSESIQSSGLSPWSLLCLRADASGGQKKNPAPRRESEFAPAGSRLITFW